MVLPETAQKGTSMFEIFKHTAEYKRLQTALQTPGAAALFGMPPVAHARLLRELAEENGQSLLVVTPGEAEATRFAQDLEALGLPAAVFPPRDFLLRPIEGAGREYEYRRLAVLGDLVGGRLRAVCVPAEALLQYTVPKAEFCANTLTLKPGMTIPVKELAARLLAAGYHRRSQVEGPGQFSVRGGIVDVFPPDSRAPARAEFWGDEIDTLNSFDILSQRRDDALEKVYISPAREVLFGDAAETAAALRSALAAQKGRRASAMEKAMEADLAQLDAGLVPEALDKYLGIRYPKPATLLDYFDNAILVLEEPSAIREAHKATQFRRTEEMKGLFEEGLLCPGLDVLYQDLPDLMHAVDSMPSLCCENFARTMPEIKLKDIVNAPAHAHPPFSGEVASLAEDLEPLTRQGYVVELLAGTSRAAAALAKDLAAKGFAATAAKDVLPGPGVVAVRPGHLTGGAEFPFAKYALFTSRKAGSADSGKKPAKKKNKDALSSLTDIKPGDYVVHQNHGIGMYTGIQRLEVQGVVKDYLKISYDKGDTLYVPVTQLDLLSRYTAPGDSDKVKLAKLGGTEWAKTRRRVKTAAAEMAQELIELYAKRRQAKGFAFPEDSDWQRDFETRFEYDETGDQLTAAAEIKKDMEKPWPMDRLLCGDVGVGKTEVALRAAFKCIMGGKQCAILAPTTLLAWQHYNGLLARMEAFPVKAGLLSRFRTPTQQKETLRGLKEGTVDVVVGTHRLLSNDVKFNDLGLVIIDEEQRFGVKHKEKLKEAFIGVDMLTLSATPIPRTLNMAMSGIRDMSTIEEPPVERQPIETYVMEYDANIVAEAIKKELARGGQVYYLHNRVDSIDACAGMVGQMVPGARIATAHGKMTEEQLSKVWQQLLDGEVDILVCTTLIETGVDVRNCNTLIIEDADKMGLAQLYQIRGRVGRSGRKAYAYFTFRRDRVLTDVAAKRLSAIREFTSFGSGFRIAMRDLQIRGAGSLLGQSQHGHMEAVGYDLYVKILNNAIAMAKGEELQPDKSECLIDITVDAYIPERYIAEAAGRIEAYKRIAAIETEEDAQDVLDELIDRYGDVPDSVAGLVDISLVRVSAARAGIYEIGQKRDALILYSDTLNAQRVKLAVAALPGRITVNSSAKPYLAVRVAPGEKPLELLKQALSALGPVQETDGEEKKA
ncbi:transcription-repair coupling factor [Allofournierella massiliensis]|nr:transcription-repair coupling factor [Fournierella massiliensis]